MCMRLDEPNSCMRYLPILLPVLSASQNNWLFEALLKVDVHLMGAKLSKVQVETVPSPGSGDYLKDCVWCI